MGEAKPWQIAVIVVGLLVLVGMLSMQFLKNDEPQFAKSRMFIDLKTGELVEVEYREDRALSIPAANPPSTEYTLVPLSKTDDGKWKVDAKFFGTVEQYKLQGPHLDMRSGIVTPTSGPVKKDVYPKRK